MTKLIYFLSLVLMGTAAFAQTGNHVFSGAEQTTFGPENLATPGGQTWVTDRGATPGYFSAMGPSGAYTGAADSTYALIDGYVKFYASAANQGFTFPVGVDGATAAQSDLRNLSISGTVPATAQYATAWIPGDPSGNLDPTSTGAPAGPHAVSSRGPGLSAVSTVGQWDWQDLSGNANGVTITVSIPDMTGFTAAAGRLRLVGWNGTQWINLSGTQGNTAGSGLTENSTLAGTMQANITAIGIGTIILPVAVNDTLTTPANTLLNGNVATNDTCGLTPCSYSTDPSDPPAHGALTLNADGTFTYTPSPGYVGRDTFSYVLCDANNNCDTAQVFIAVNGAPVAVNDTVTTPANTPLNGNVATNDTCGLGPCNYSADPSDPPAHGTLTLNPDGTYTYTPTPGYIGTDTFSYVVCNSGTPVICDTAKVFVAVNGAPVAVNDTVTTPANTPLNGNVATNDTCGVGPCSYSSDPADPPAHGTLTVNPNGTYTYTPTPGYAGTDTFSYIVCNGGTPVRCDTATVFVTVNGAPVAVNDTVTTPANTPLNGNVATNDTCGVGPCSYSSDPADPPAHGTLTVNPNGTYTYTPTPGYAGTDTFGYIVCNGGTPVLCDTATVFVTVNGAPVAVNDTVTTTSNTPLNGNVATNDTCGVGPCSYSPDPSHPPAHGTLTMNPNGTYTYTPDPGYTGTDTFGYVVCNGGTPVLCDTAQVAITISTNLPVDLLSFTARAASDCNVLLAWTTGVEERFSHFDIESGTNSAVFAKVGQVAAKGSGNSYTYPYHQGLKGLNFFRLRLVDQDGSYQYSSIVSANLSCAPARNIRVYPTVNRGRVTVDGLLKGETVLVYDMKGIVLMQRLAEGPSEELDLSHATEGSYIVVVVTTTGDHMHYKIIKK